MYSSPTCVKCKILATKLTEKGYNFVKEEDQEKVSKIGKSVGIMGLPIVGIDNKFYTFEQAIDLLI
jgi:hypothetical protein